MIRVYQNETCIHRQFASAVQPKNANEICYANASLLY